MCVVVNDKWLAWELANWTCRDYVQSMQPSIRKTCHSLIVRGCFVHVCTCSFVPSVCLSEVTAQVYYTCMYKLQWLIYLGKRYNYICTKDCVSPVVVCVFSFKTWHRIIPLLALAYVHVCALTCICVGYIGLQLGKFRGINNCGKFVAGTSSFTSRALAVQPAGSIVPFVSVFSSVQGLGGLGTSNGMVGGTYGWFKLDSFFASSLQGEAKQCRYYWQ